MSDKSIPTPKQKISSHSSQVAAWEQFCFCLLYTSQNCCHPNALMTLREYLDDYASPETREIGMKMILAELDNIPNPKVREIVERNLSGIDAGARDFRF